VKSRQFVLIGVCFFGFLVGLQEAFGQDGNNNIPTWTIFWGRFHPVIVHLPIGCLLIGALLLFLGNSKRLGKLSTAAVPMLWLGGFFALLSVLSGYLLSLSSEYDEQLLNTHFWMGLSVVIKCLIIYLTLKFSNKNP